MAFQYSTQWQEYMGNRDCGYGHPTPTSFLVGLLTSGLSLADSANLSDVVAGEHPNSNGYARRVLGRQITAVDTAGNTLTVPEHELPANSKILLISDGSFPGGLTVATPFYVGSPTTNTFQPLSSSGGSVIDITSIGSGNHFIKPFCLFDSGSDKRAEAPKDAVDFNLSSASIYQGFFILANAIPTIGSTAGSENLNGIGSNAMLVGWEYLDSPSAITYKRIYLNRNIANIGNGTGI